jgi:hypothetical protein
MDIESFIFFGLLAAIDGSLLLLSGLVFLLLVAVWLRTSTTFLQRVPALGLPPLWLHLPLAGLTLLAVLLAATVPALLLSWSLLILAWTAVGLTTLGLGQAWRAGVWLWGPVGWAGIVAATMPLPDSLYAQAGSLPFSIQLMLGLGLLFPCISWSFWDRHRLAEWPRPTAWLLLAWPALAGGLLLLRWLLAAGSLPLLLVLLLLSGLLLGIGLGRPRQLLAGRGWDLPLRSLRARLAGWGHSLHRATYEALLLLEGEAGLLWLLGLFILLLLLG